MCWTYLTIPGEGDSPGLDTLDKAEKIKGWESLKNQAFTMPTILHLRIYKKCASKINKFSVYYWVHWKLLLTDHLSVEVPCSILIHTVRASCSIWPLFLIGSASDSSCIPSIFIQASVLVSYPHYTHPLVSLGYLQVSFFPGSPLWQPQGISGKQF